MARIILLALLFTTLSACSVFNSDKKSSQHLSHEEIKQAWEQSMAVTEEHKLIESMAGTWDASVKFWTQPGTKPHISMAKSTCKSILNGKFLLEDYKGSFSGKPFEGMSIMGYDTTLKTFSNYWVDNMGTGAIYSEGKIDPETKIISLKGHVTDPLSQSKKTTYSIIRITDENNHIFEMYDVLPEGKKFKTLEITYTKK